MHTQNAITGKHFAKISHKCNFASLPRKERYAVYFVFEVELIELILILS